MLMKLNSVSGIVFAVKDLGKSVEFYEEVGFIFKNIEPTYAKAYFNWFWLEFVQQDALEPSVFKKAADIASGGRGSGQFIQIGVQSADDTYNELVAKGLKPFNEPQTFPWKRREFILQDPDGYRLVFFEKK